MRITNSAKHRDSQFDNTVKKRKKLFKDMQKEKDKEWQEKT